MKEFTRASRSDRVADRASLAINGAVGRLDRIHILAAILAVGLTTYLAIEPTQNWLLLLLAGLAGLGTDGLVRTNPKARFRRLDDTALFLFVPVLFTMGLGLFLEEVASGYWTIGAGLASFFAYWAILHAEYESVNRNAADYQLRRLVLNGATYVIAFLFFATIYTFDMNLMTAAFAAGIVSILLAIEVLREEAMETGRTIMYAMAIGLLLAQATVATHFLPLEGGAAAVFLLLAFYLMTGMMHNYLANRLTLRTASEFTAVAVSGIAIVAVSHSYL